MATRVRLELLLSLLIWTSCEGLNITIVTTASPCNPQDECSAVTCRCDPVCLFFEDCCLDYMEVCAHEATLATNFLDATEGITSDHLSCTVPPHSNSSRNTTAFSMVDECASNWHNELTRANCERPSNENDIFSLTPVSLGSFLSFKNAYCAICNRKSISELTLWTFQSECGSQILNISSNVTFQERITILMEGCRNWFFIPPPSGSTDVRVCTDKLDFTISPIPHEVSTDPASVPLAPLSTIEPDPGSLDIELVNPAYTFDFHSVDPLITGSFSSISVLIDFTSLDDAPFLEETVSVVCNYTEVFSPSLKRCVKLSCPAGYSLLNRSCVDSTRANKRCSNNNQIRSIAKLSCEHEAIGVSFCSPSWSIANETVSWLANNSNHLLTISVQEISTTWMNISSSDSGFGTCVQVVTLSFDLSRDFMPFRQSSENALFVAPGNTNSKNLTCRISAVDVSIGCVRKEDRFCLNNSIRFTEFKVIEDSSSTRFLVGETNTSYAIEDSLYTQRFRWNINNTRNEAADLLVCNRREYSSKCALITLSISDFVVWSNGSVLYEPLSVVFDHDDYTIVNNDSIQVCSFFAGSGDLTREYYFVAFSPGQSITSFVGCLLSMVGLLFTFVTYAKYEGLRKSICSQLVMSLCVSLTLAQVTLLFSGIAKSNSISCTCVAVLGHYLWLAVFAHAMALALDLYRRFGLTQKVKKTLEGPKILSMFLVFAWGSPLFVVMPCLVVHLCSLPNVALTYGTINSCWIGNGFMNLYVFGVPMALTLIVNGAIFVLVIAGLRKRANQTTKRKTSKMATECVLYLKMSTLLGFTWLFGFVAAFADVTALWYIFIILNSLQGVYIFIAFICNKRVFKLWRESSLCKPCVSLTIQCPCSRSPSGDQSTGNTASSTWISSSVSSVKKGTSSTAISMTEASSSYSMHETKQIEIETDSPVPSAHTDKSMNESMSIKVMAELTKKFDNKV